LVTGRLRKYTREKKNGFVKFQLPTAVLQAAPVTREHFIVLALSKQSWKTDHLAQASLCSDSETVGIESYFLHLAAVSDCIFTACLGRAFLYPVTVRAIWLGVGCCPTKARRMKLKSSVCTCDCHCCRPSTFYSKFQAAKNSENQKLFL
jgi:hypothetical protein